MRKTGFYWIKLPYPGWVVGFWQADPDSIECEGWRVPADSCEYVDSDLVEIREQQLLPPELD